MTRPGGRSSVFSPHDADNTRRAYVATTALTSSSGKVPARSRWPEADRRVEDSRALPGRFLDGDREFARDNVSVGSECKRRRSRRTSKEGRVRRFGSVPDQPWGRNVRPGEVESCGPATSGYDHPSDSSSGVRMDSDLPEVHLPGGREFVHILPDLLGLRCSCHRKTWPAHRHPDDG